MTVYDNLNIDIPDSGNGFEEWACDDFNLLDYVDHGNVSPLDNSRDGYDEMQKKDNILQYHEELLGGGDQQPPSDPFVDVTTAAEAPFCHFPYAAVPSVNFMVKEKGAFATKHSIPSTVPLKERPTIEALDASMDYAPQQHSFNQTQTMVEHFTPSPSFDLPPNSYTSCSPSFSQLPANNGYQQQEKFAPSSSNGNHQQNCRTEQTELRPNARPRKYRVKADYEKRNPQYRMKREKNNDAVRRSRDKARRQQEEKDRRLAFLEAEALRQAKIIAELRQRNELMEAQLIGMKRSCTCRMRR